MRLDVVGQEGIPDAQRLSSVCYGARAEPVEWWRWWLFGRGEESSRIAVAYGPGGVVGMQPVSFFPFVWGGKTGQCALLTGGMIAPESRGKGLFRRLVDTAVAEAWRRDCRIVLTMPNERSAPAFERFGWTNLGDRSAMVWLGSRNSAGRGRASGAPVKSLPELSEESIASLVAAGAGEPVAMIARDAGWLRWRYRGNPLAEYVVVHDPEETASEAAIAVGTIRILRGVRVGWLVDVIGRGDAPRSRAVVALARELRRQGAVIVASVVGGRRTRGELEGAGFWRVPALLVPKRFRTVCLARESQAAPIPVLLDEWSMTLADWDGV